jgi:divalent metal cation (Fe/Co/Zn/Cd) transporter
MVDPKATAMEIYHTNEKIERKLHKDFDVFDVTVTIIPDPDDLKK